MTLSEANLIKDTALFLIGFYFFCKWMIAERKLNKIQAKKINKQTKNRYNQKTSPSRKAKIQQL